MIKLFFPVGALLLVALIACNKTTEGEYDCTGTVPTYTTDIKPILTANCSYSGCHDPITQEAGIDLSTYASAKAQSTQANFLGSVQHKAGFEAMPQGGLKLDEAKQKLLYCWVENGSPE